MQRQRQKMFFFGGGLIIFLNIKIEFQRAQLVAEAFYISEIQSHWSQWSEKQILMKYLIRLVFDWHFWKNQ